MYPYRQYPIPYQFVQPASKSTAFSLASIQKWTGTAQQFIKTANRYMPYVQQYGPMIKNFPSMWKLYKAFNELDSGDEKEQKSHDKPKQVAVPDKEPERTTSESIPKLYI
ncbi:VrrA/YqfQ family protein [Jeotgalibacillus malaysiensis]|uniref:VrrA/YqfQ family protein n=1 Tax=Jeotgalibacillus malaysiensis TaxID=1508404 RepID=UPI003850296E